MKPFLTEAQFLNGQTVCQKMIASLQKAEVDVGSSLAGLMTATVIAAETMGTPLESVFACMRHLRKAYLTAAAQAEGAAQADAASKLIVTGIERGDDPPAPTEP